MYFNNYIALLKSDKYSTLKHLQILSGEELSVTVAMLAGPTCSVPRVVCSVMSVTEQTSGPFICVQDRDVILMSNPFVLCQVWSSRSCLFYWLKMLGFKETG